MIDNLDALDYLLGSILAFGLFVKLVLLLTKKPEYTSIAYEMYGDK